MNEIIPAILPENIGELRGKTELVLGIVPMIQIDFCDGIYVPTKTWPHNGKDTQFYNTLLKEEEGLPYWEDMSFEFDMMCKNAHKDFANLLKLGPARIIFHLGAEDDLLSFFKNLDMSYFYMIEFGVALRVTDDPLLLKEYIPYIHFVQCMGIEHIGQQGQPFDERVIEQIKKVKELYPTITISVDGGVNRSSIHRLMEAGASRFVAGSAIYYEEDIETGINDLRHSVNI